MGWKSTQTKTGNQIVMALFSEHKTQDELRRIIVGKKWKEKEVKSRSKDSLNNIVSNYIRAFEELGYILEVGEKERISNYHKNLAYALQLKFFFDYANEILPKGKKLIYRDKSKKKGEDCEDAFYLDYDMIPKGVREIILKYPIETLLEKIKLFLFDAYVLQNFYLRLDNNTREKIRLINGLPLEISEEVRKLESPDEDKTEELRRKQTFGGYISPRLIEESNKDKMYEDMKEEIKIREWCKLKNKKS